MACRKFHQEHPLDQRLTRGRGEAPAILSRSPAPTERRAVMPVSIGLLAAIRRTKASNTAHTNVIIVAAALH
jgi:hypothetical protein